MNEVIIPSLHLLAGVCAYATATHLSAGFRRPFELPHVVFAGLTLVALLFALSQAIVFQAADVSEYILALKFNLALAALLYLLMIWFIALYTGKRPLPLLVGLSVFFVILFIVNLAQPYSLQYDYISKLSAARMQWGESLNHAVGHNSNWFYVGVAWVVASWGYTLYALGSLYRSTRNHHVLSMIVGFGVLLLMSTQGILVRLSIIDFVNLGPFGYLAMIIVMSVVLRHETQQRLLKSQEEMKLAALVYRASGEAMMLTDADNIILSVNPAFTEITGYSEEEVRGKNPKTLSSGTNNQGFYQAMWQLINTTGRWQGEVLNRRKNGELFHERLSISTIYHDDGTVHRRVSLFSDVTEEKKSDELIWQQANFDALTGLPNRRRVYDRLDQDIKKSHRMGLPLALLFIDLDQFKEINDTLGHRMGDELLKQAALRMVRCVREGDTVARLGGDEFTIILGELDDVDSVGRVAKNILNTLAEPYRLGSEMAYISASIGIAMYPVDATDVATLMQYADQSMYAAKCDGRNRFRYYTPSMQESVKNRMRLSNDLRVALIEQQFLVYYQPIVELATADIYKAEALIRWQHPARGLISPADFIPIAEDTGLIVEIGDWVFRQAAAQVIQLRKIHHPNFQISVNKSPVQFRSGSDKHVSWFDHLKELGLPGQSIIIEITESLLMEARNEISSQLSRFRGNGMQVSLDDFGTGYSSLSYIRKFDIDYLKIDQSFVRELAPNSEDLALCEAIIEMAHKLDIKVIAEGVETQDQCNLLQQIGCDYGQGYLWSKPLPAAEFEALLIKI